MGIKDIYQKDFRCVSTNTNLHKYKAEIMPFHYLSEYVFLQSVGHDAKSTFESHGQYWKFNKLIFICLQRSVFRLFPFILKSQQNQNFQHKGVLF